MAKIKLTKGELKKERDGLRRYERYLPILQLKKQQLQMEIARETAMLDDRKAKEAQKSSAAGIWAGVLTDRSVDIKAWIKPVKVNIDKKNIAGVDVPVFRGAEYADAKYDLFSTPLWVDMAIDSLRTIVSLREEVKAFEKSVSVLRRELRITTQRVNLFEKVKIPEAQDAIRRIKIYIGDQMTNAVGRSKIAKRKIAATELEEAFA